MLDVAQELLGERAGGGGGAGVPGPARAARWLAGDVAKELQELVLLAEGGGGDAHPQRRAR